MAVPLAYNLRNLMVRRTTTVMTVIGIALTVAVLVAALALVNGLHAAFQSSGNPLNILLLRKGSNSELSSAMTRGVFEDMLFKPGIARPSGGDRPMASLEIITTINLPRAGSPTGMAVTLRGLLPVGIELRNLKLQEGRWFRAGQHETVVGKFIAKRYPVAHLGGHLRFGKRDWEVVGVMDGGQSVANSEIFGDLNQVSSSFNRFDSLSSILLRAADQEAVLALVNSLNDDQRLTVVAQTEKAYYDRQTTAGAPLEALGLFVATIMAVGSIFAAMNTMYAAVARRAKEIGTLRVLGFSRGSILTSFLVESLLLAMLGGIIGCMLTQPLNNITTGIGNFITVSEISFNFRVGPSVMLTGIIFALFIGVLGGLFPARMAAKKEILAALRGI
jgi:putative ABC transport system permease protein